MQVKAIVISVNGKERKLPVPSSLDKLTAKQGIMLASTLKDREEIKGRQRQSLCRKYHDLPSAPNRVWGGGHQTNPNRHGSGNHGNGRSVLAVRTEGAQIL